MATRQWLDCDFYDARCLEFGAVETGRSERAITSDPVPARLLPGLGDRLIFLSPLIRNSPAATHARVTCCHSNVLTSVYEVSYGQAPDEGPNVRLVTRWDKWEKKGKLQSTNHNNNKRNKPALAAAINPVNQGGPQHWHFLSCPIWLLTDRRGTSPVFVLYIKLLIPPYPYVYFNRLPAHFLFLL